MKLPHQEPLIFAKKICSLNEKEASVQCSFEETPSLAVFIEAAAQSSAAFFQEGNYKLGFLANAKNIVWLNKTVDKEFIIKLTLNLTFETMSNYSFIVCSIDEQITVCSGEFTVSIQ
ncbi:hypothetical protein OAR97_00255 [Arcobacteraceae bacterium]|nr:hypothetical protein [Arcobacteraceae bacterium]